MLADEVGGRAAHLGLGQVTRRRERPKEQVRRDEEREQSGQADGERHLRQLVVEGERRRLPQQQVARAAHDLPGRRAVGRRGGDRDERGDEQAGEEQRNPPDGRAERRRLVPDVERAAARPEQRRGGDGDSRLLHVEPLDEVERGERRHQHQREAKCTRAPAEEVVRRDEKRERHRHGECVCGAHDPHGLDVHEQVAAPHDVACHGRDEVDQRDDRDAGRGDRGHVVQVTRRAEPQRPPVQAEAPHPRVVTGPREVGPVLHDQPEARDRDDDRRLEREHAEPYGHGVRDEHGEAEVPFVDAPPEDVEAQAQPVSVDPKHRARPQDG